MTAASEPPLVTDEDTRQNDPTADFRRVSDGEARIYRAMKWSAKTAAAVTVALIIWWNVSQVVNRPLPPSPFDTLPIVLPVYPESNVTEFPNLRFTDITESAGIDAVVPNGATGEVLLPETVAGGCAVFDVDGDGDCDILLIGNAPWNGNAGHSSSLKLYLNDGTAKFDDATEAFGLQISGHFMAAAAGDVNGDGAIDLFISGVGDNRLLVQKNGRFEDVTATAGVRQTIDTDVPPDATSFVMNADEETKKPILQPENAWGTSCCFWDYDRDGDLDLFVCNYVMWSNALDAELDCTTTGTSRGYCPPEAFTGSHPFLYRNDGGGHFTEVSAEAGLVLRQRDTGELLGKSLGFAICDLDFDGWLDMLVANDSTQNEAYLNQQDGTFRSIGIESGWAFDSSGKVRRAFGIDAAWLPESKAWAVAMGTPTGESVACYRLSPDVMQFNDDALLLGLGPESTLPNSISPLWCDFDLDGRLDLFIANGGWDPDLVKLRETQTPAQSPAIYWNSGADQFVALKKDVLGDDFFQPIVSRSAAIADFDGDGDTDVLIVAGGGQPRLLRNDQQSGHHWLRVKLEGIDAVGARVEIIIQGRRQQWVANPHRGYMGQSELAVTFGLGSAASVDELIVHWPNGEIERRESITADQILLLHSTAMLE